MLQQRAIGLVSMVEQSINPRRVVNTEANLEKFYGKFFLFYFSSFGEQNPVIKKNEKQPTRDLRNRDFYFHVIHILRL